MSKVNSEPSAVYLVESENNNQLTIADREIIQQAIDILDSRIRNTDPLNTPDMSKKYLRLQLARETSEVFCALWLDNRHRVITFERLFFGTIDGCSVHAREVVKKGLQHNAAAVIFSHNHPSGITEPSAADKAITQRLKDALALVDIKALDHVIVGDDCLSFAEKGLI